MRRHPGNALLLAVLAAAGLAGLAACSQQSAPTLVTLQVLGKRNAPTDASWVAVADGTGVWHPLSSSSPGTYQVRPDRLGRYSIALGCASDPPSVTVFHGTIDEALTLTAKCEAEDDEGCADAMALPASTPQASPVELRGPAPGGTLTPLAGALLYTIDVAGLPPGERAFTYFHGDPLALDEAMGPVYVSLGRDNVLFFTLIAPETAVGSGAPAANAVTAWSWSTASSGQPAVHVIAGGIGGNVAVPEHGTATVLGAYGDAVAAKATLKLPHAVRVPLGNAGSDTLTYHLVPATLSAESDEATTMLSATAVGAPDATGARPIRVVRKALPLGAAADETLALPTTPMAATDRLPDGTVRWSAYRDAQLGAAQAYQLTTTVGPAAAPTLVWRAAITPGWLAVGGATESFQYRNPDLAAVAGSGWLLQDAAGTWELDALLGMDAAGGSLDLPSVLRGEGPESPDTTLWSAGRSGPL